MQMRDRNGNVLNVNDPVFICRNLRFGHVVGFRHGLTELNTRVIIDSGEKMLQMPVLFSVEPWEVEKIIVQEKIENG